jgi:osmotically-inducible protein OsmY
MKSRMWAFIVVGFLATAGITSVAATASAAEAVNVPGPNGPIVQAVSKEVLRYVNFTVFDDVSMSINNGVVTLMGRVTMPYKKDDLGRRVARVDGVKEVQNQIQVLPVSQFDDELRFRIARAIYGNSTFWHYAAMANPPIHIVVERGHVRLTGVVNSNVERVLARSLATGFGEFSVTNDLKTDAEMQQVTERLE